ncbi:hypothetical protein [Heyndrickxia sp. FSL W8-0423]|uniref:hypothetical protein n=1 Tax=Heyndrickxia sp. FSL W8-0423 TaxID=2921601 RepID=UPI0030F93344
MSAIVSTEDETSPSRVLKTPKRAFACGLHIVLRQKGEVYIGATNVISPKVVDNPILDDIVFLIDCAYRQIRRNLSKGTLNRLQVGNRPVSLDGYSLLGESNLKGLWRMTGTYRVTD